MFGYLIFAREKVALRPEIGDVLQYRKFQIAEHISRRQIVGDFLDGKTLQRLFFNMGIVRSGRMGDIHHTIGR